MDDATLDYFRSQVVAHVCDVRKDRERQDQLARALGEHVAPGMRESIGSRPAARQAARQAGGEARRVSVRSWISGARWHGLKALLYDGAVRCGLDLQILDEEKGWFGHTVYFRVTGPEDRVRALGRGLKRLECSPDEWEE